MFGGDEGDPNDFNFYPKTHLHLDGFAPLTKRSKNPDPPTKQNKKQSQTSATSPTPLKTKSKTRKQIKTLTIYEPGESTALVCRVAKMALPPRLVQHDDAPGNGR